MAADAEEAEKLAKIKEALGIAPDVGDNTKALWVAIDDGNTAFAEAAAMSDGPEKEAALEKIRANVENALNNSVDILDKRGDKTLSAAALELIEKIDIKEAEEGAEPPMAAAREKIWADLDVALHSAAAEGNTEKVKLALENEADLLSVVNGKTAYELAVEAGKSDAAKMLGNHANDELNALVAEGKHERLKAALEHGGAQALSDQGIDAMLLANNDDAIDGAAVPGSGVSLKMLQKAARREAQDVLFDAVAKGGEEGLKAMEVAVAANPEVLVARSNDGNGRTAYEIAVDSGDTEFAEVLAQKATARIEHLMTKSDDPDPAKKHDPATVNPEDIQKLLLHAGASVSAKAVELAKEAETAAKKDKNDAVVAGDKDKEALAAVREARSKAVVALLEEKPPLTVNNISAQFLKDLEAGKTDAAKAAVENVDALQKNELKQTGYELARIKQKQAIDAGNNDLADTYGSIAESLAKQATQRLPHLVNDDKKLEVALQHGGAHVGSEEFEAALKTAEAQLKKASAGTKEHENLQKSFDTLKAAKEDKASHDLFAAKTVDQVKDALAHDADVLERNMKNQTAYELATDDEVKKELAKQATLKLGTLTNDPVKMQVALNQGGADASSAIGRNALEDIDAKLASESVSADEKENYALSKALLEKAMADNATKRLVAVATDPKLSKEERDNGIKAAIDDKANFIAAYTETSKKLGLPPGDDSKHPLKSYMNYYQDKVVERDDVAAVQALKATGVDTTHLESYAARRAEQGDSQKIAVHMMEEELAKGMEAALARAPSYDKAGRTATGFDEVGYNKQVKWDAAKANPELLRGKVGDLGIGMAPEGATRAEINYETRKVTFSKGRDTLANKKDDIVMSFDELAPKGKLKLDLSRAGGSAPVELTISGVPKAGDPITELAGKADIRGNGRALNAKNDDKYYLVSDNDYTLASMARSADLPRMNEVLHEAQQAGDHATRLAAMQAKAMQRYHPTVRMVRNRAGHMVNMGARDDRFKVRNTARQAGGQAFADHLMKAGSEGELALSNPEERRVDGGLVAGRPGDSAKELDKNGNPFKPSTPESEKEALEMLKKHGLAGLDKFNNPSAPNGMFPGEAGMGGAGVNGPAKPKQKNVDARTTG